MTQTSQNQNQNPALSTTNPDAAGTTLVLAGTGKTGARVAARLTALGASVRIGSRSARPPFD